MYRSLFLYFDFEKRKRLRELGGGGPVNQLQIRLTLFGQATWAHLLIKILFMRRVPSFHLLAGVGVGVGGGGEA